MTSCIKEGTDCYDEDAYKGWNSRRTRSTNGGGGGTSNSTSEE